MGKGCMGEDAVDEGDPEEKRKQPVGRRHGCQQVGVFQWERQPAIHDEFAGVGNKEIQKIHGDAGR